MRSFAYIFAFTLTLTSVAIADDRIELTTGDVLTGEITAISEEQVTLEHAVLGTINIPRDQIAVMPDPLPELEPAPIEEPPAKPTWESQIDLGFAGSRGNSDTLDVRAAFETRLETETDRWRIDAAYYYGESDGETSKNQFTAGVLKDWLMPDSPWLIFAQARYDYDDFKQWLHRASGHGGFGYEFFNTDEFLLIGRVGAGAAKEWKPSDSLRPEGLLGAELRWKINDRQTLSAHTTLYPDLGDFFEFRVVSGIAWNMAIDTARGLSLNFGIDNEYESSTEGDIEHNDFKFYGGLSIGF